MDHTGLQRPATASAFYDLAVAKVPNAKEFAALYRKMDLVTKSRLERLVWRGQQGSDPDEAALLVALSERALRQLRWIVALSALVAALSLLSAALSEEPVFRWTSLAVVAAAAIAIPVHLLWRRPRLLRGQVRNRELAQEDPSEA
jgi:hypothetical protein